MALMINEDCTACDACKPACPNQAIAAGDPIFAIDALRCTECVGSEHDEPQCRLMCPAIPSWLIRTSMRPATSCRQSTKPCTPETAVFCFIALISCSRRKTAAELRQRTEAPSSNARR